MGSDYPYSAPADTYGPPPHHQVFEPQQLYEVKQYVEQINPPHHIDVDITIPKGNQYLVFSSSIVSQEMILDDI